MPEMGSLQGKLGSPYKSVKILKINEMGGRLFTYTLQGIYHSWVFESGAKTWLFFLQPKIIDNSDS
jgi:hypothetical protein